MLDKIKEVFERKEGESNKKKIENLVVFVIILVITLIVINVILNGDKKENSNTKTDENKKLADTSIQSTNDIKEVSQNTEDKLILNLESILSKINGVGEVKVMVTYSETSKTVPVYNEETTQEETEEKDTRWTEQEK